MPGMWPRGVAARLQSRGWWTMPRHAMPCTHILTPCHARTHAYICHGLWQGFIEARVSHHDPTCSQVQVPCYYLRAHRATTTRWGF